MTQLFLVFIYLSSAIAVLATLVICIRFFMNSSAKNDSYVANITSINSQIGICKRAGVIFTLFEWFLFSCEEKNVCLNGYVRLSITCMQVGIGWICLAFLCIIFNIFLIMRKEGGKITACICKFRNSSFGIGSLYILLSFILDV